MGGGEGGSTPEPTLDPPLQLFKEPSLYKVSKGAKIRNRYNQVPNLAQDTNGKVTNSTTAIVQYNAFYACLIWF